MKKIIPRKANAKERKQLEDKIKHPVFCFRYLHKNYHVDNCDDREKLRLMERIVKLCGMTWHDIKYAGRHALGSEKIDLNTIKLDLPEDIAEDVNFFLALRFDGKKAFVGYRNRFIFHVLYIDRDFTLYDH